MDLEAALAELVSGIEGARGVYLIDREAILVASVAAPGFDGEEFGARLTVVLREVKRITSQTLQSELRSVTLELEQGRLVLLLLEGGFTLALLLAPDANVGRARYYLRRLSFALAGQL